MKTMKTIEYPVSERIITGNPNSSIVVVLPSFKIDLMKEIMGEINPAFVMALDSRLFESIIFPTNFGLTDFLYCVVSNPNIKNIFIYSEIDFPYFHEYLKGLIKEEQSFKVPYGLELEDRVIPPKLKDTFRNQIKVIEKMNNLDKIKEFAEHTQFSSKDLVHIQGRKINSIKSNLYPKLKKKIPTQRISPVAISHTSISEAYPHLVQEILNKGLYYKFDQSGREVIEALNATVHLSDPLSNPIPENYSPYGIGLSMEKEELLSYLDTFYRLYITEDKSVMRYKDSMWLLEPESVIPESASPGRRIKHYSSHSKDKIIINQLENVANVINVSLSEKLPSRRIIVSLINPIVDCNSSVSFNPPGLIYIQFFPRQNHDNHIWRLDGTFYIRSHDVFKVFPANAYAAAKLLDYIVTKVKNRIYNSDIKLKTGSCHLILGSAHIYLSDLRTLKMSSN